MTQHILSWLVEQPRCVLDCATENAFVFGKTAKERNAEVFVWCSTESTQVVVGGRIDELPVEEVTGAVEYGLDVTFSEVTTLYNGVDGLQQIRRTEFEGTCDEQSVDGSIARGRLREVEYGVYSRLRTM